MPKPPHLFDDGHGHDFYVDPEFDRLDKRVAILEKGVEHAPVAWVDNDDVPNIGVSGKGYGYDVATLMAAAPKLRDMVKKLIAENSDSNHIEEAHRLLDSVTFTVVLPEDYEGDDDDEEIKAASVETTKLMVAALQDAVATINKVVAEGGGKDARTLHVDTVIAGTVLGKAQAALAAYEKEKV